MNSKIMNENSTKLVANNTNLLKDIYSYLEVKDLCSVAAVNKNNHHLSLAFNAKWQDACFRYFSSEYGFHRYNYQIFTKSILEQALYHKKLKKSNEFKDESLYMVNWKRFFKAGIEIKNNWKSFANYHPAETEFHQDVKNSLNEVLGSLKGKNFKILLFKY